MKKLLCTSFILGCLLLGGCSFSGNSSDAQLIGEDKAIDIVMAEHTLSQNSIENIQVSLDEGLMRDSYVITFDLCGHTYNYDVDAVSGKITSISVD